MASIMDRMGTERESAPVPTQLSNGMTLIDAPLAGSNNVTVGLVIRRGERDELPSESGLSDFIGGLFFTQPTGGPDTDALLAEIEGMGASINFDVGVETTVFSISGRARDLPRLTAIMGRLATDAGMVPDDIETVRAEVLNAIDRSALSPDKWVADHLFAAAYAPGTAIARADLPDRKSIENATRDQLLAFREQLFNPANMAIVVSGGASLDAAEAQSQFGALKSVGTPRPRTTPEWNMSTPPWVGKVRPTAAGDRDKLNISAAIPGLPMGDPDKDALIVLNDVLGGGMSRRLMAEVRGRLGLAYNIDAGPVPMSDTGIFVMATSTQPNNGARALQAGFQQLRDLAGEGATVTPDELLMARRHSAFMLSQATQTAGDRAGYYASQWAAGRPLTPPAERAAALAKVTADDVTRVAKRLVANLPLARVAFVGPRDQGRELTNAITGAAVSGQGAMAL